MRSQRLFFAAFLVSAVFGATNARGQGIEALQRLGAALRGAPAWSAHYSQEYIAAGMDAGEVVAGTVTVAWPDRALFLTGDPVVQKMGLEGRSVRLVDLEVPSCDEHVLSDEEWARVPLAAVLDPIGAVEHFTVLGHGKNGLSLLPKEPGGVDRVEITLDAESLPAEVVIVDPQGATNRLVFDGWVATGPPGESGWLPVPPPDLECVAD